MCQAVSTISHSFRNPGAGYLERFYVWNIINTHTIFWRMVGGKMQGADHLFDDYQFLLTALLAGGRYKPGYPETHIQYGILHRTWNIGRFPLPLQPIKTIGSFSGSIQLIINRLQR